MSSGDITKIKRHPERAHSEKETLLDILNNGFACQVAFQVDGQPFIIPMTYYNNSEYIYLHGSPVARISDTLRNNTPVAISVLELNGLVLAKGLADNSMNYRSAIVFGKPEEVVGDEEKLSFFIEWIERLVPGRKENTELPNKDELRGVSVFRVKLEQFSVKIRTGGPSEVRRNPGIWSGVVPFSIKFSNPEFASGTQIPDYVKRFIDLRNGDKK